MLWSTNWTPGFREKTFLQQKTAEHSVLLERIPAIVPTCNQHGCCCGFALHARIQLLTSHCAAGVGPCLLDSP